jgi:hypothetical protein
MTSWLHKRYTSHPCQAKGTTRYGRPADLYLVVTYLMRPDNQGRVRLFRTVKGHATLKEATKWYDARVATSKYLRAELLKASDLALLASHGNEAAEDAWVDTNLDR